MAIPVDGKRSVPRVQGAKPRTSTASTAQKKAAYAKSTRDEMSTGVGRALRSAAEQKLAARPFSAKLDDLPPRGGFRVGPGGALTPAGSTPPPAPEGGTVINPKLHEFMQANPDIKTVQDLVNHCYHQPGGGWGTFESTCKGLDLDPLQLNTFRSANLEDWAVRFPPPEGVPHTVEEANEFFLNQYKTDFNEYAGDGVSNNCGPTSLAMCMQVEGKMPAGLNEEQRIDYARALMYPKLDAKAYTPAVDPNGDPILGADGSQLMLLDRDSALTGIGDQSAGVIAGTSGAGLTATHQTGWDALDDSLATGHPVVVEGNITQDWRTTVAAGGEGSYAGGGDGHFIAILGKNEAGQYLVADPMYSGGAVAMDKADLQKFFSKQGNQPSFAGHPAPPREEAP